jgi:histone H3/H4
MSDLLVVRSKIKECTSCNVSGEFADSLSKEVERLIKNAERRAKANNRSTIKPRDL